MKRQIRLVAVCSIFLTIRVMAQNSFPTGLTAGTGPNFSVSSTGQTAILTPSGGPLLHVRQVGTGYGSGSANAALLLETDGGGGNNYLLSGSAAGALTFSLRADGQAYFGGNIGIGTPTPEAPLVVASGYVSGGDQVYNALTVRPGSGSGGHGGNGASIFFGSRTNHGVDPVAGIWSALTSGGDGGVNYAGALVLGTVLQGSAIPVEAARIDGNGNFGIGTNTPGAKLEVHGNVKLSGGGSSITFPDGSNQNVAWNGTLCGGDYAEIVNASGDHQRYEPGDVLVLSDHSGSDVSKSSQPYSTLVSGIYSTKPGVVGRRQIGEKSDTEIPMAMVGIVPTKVSAENGPVRRGDLLVTSSTEGHAMKGTDQSRMLGAIVGKALGSLDSGTGVIEVLVSLQ